MSHADGTPPDPQGRGQGARTTEYSTDRGERRATSDEAYLATDDGRPSGAVAATPNRHDVVAAERERHGGVKIGSAFFGWLTAMGMAVILTALVAAAGTAVGLATGTTVDQATSSASSDPTTVGLVGIIALLVILFVAYYCGGYVAGRMARFDGAKQGVAVWLWALVAAVVVAVLGAVAGAKFNVLANLNSFPRIPVNEGQVSTAGIIAALVAAAAALLGAVLGGLAGMRFHRRVDRTALGD
ncbi:MAG: hypothetical protein ACJ714_15135 [Ornithinibacter sp.]